MAKLSLGGGAPTMIIPGGTQIQVDAHGQLSIRTPGNLVIQNSGAYAVLESVSGSIRIEPQVSVEAVTVRCAETCFVQGSLTAWRVVAKTLHLEGEAQAHVVMQETERLEVGRNARLVGNFTSEKELFSLFSRFTRQLRALPFPVEGDTAATGPAAGAGAADAVLEVEARVEGVAGEGGEEMGEHQRYLAQSRDAREVDAERAGAAAGGSLTESAEGGVAGGASAPTPQRRPPGSGELAELPEDLFFALVLLEREAERPTYGPTPRRILRELAKLLREGDVETLRHTYRTLFARIREPGGDLRRAIGLVERYFEAHSRAGGGGAPA